MAINCLLLQFNNYFNKKVKYYATVDDYISHANNAEYSTTQNGKVADITCWNPNDGIDTVLNVRWHGKWNPDYLLIIEDGKINSRWFIKEPKFLSKGNYNFVLRRDVIADRYEHVLTAPCFIEKGHVDAESPLIFNKEDFACNQIKVDEKLIHDRSYCAWIIVYYNLTSEAKAKLTGTVSTIEEPYINLGVANIESWSIMQKYGENGYRIPNINRFTVDIDILIDPRECRVNFNKYAQYLGYEEPYDLDTTELEHNKTGFVSAAKRCIKSNETNIRTALGNFALPDDTLATIMSYKNKIVKTNDGKFYKVSIKVSQNNENVKRFINVTGTSTVNGENALATALMNAFKTDGVFKDGFSGGFTDAFLIDYDVTKYIITCEPVVNGVKTYDFDFSNLLDNQEIQDEPYGILAFPYKDVGDLTIKVLNEEVDGNLPMEIVRQLTIAGTGNDKPIYDVQILPFCPITSLSPKVRWTGGGHYYVEGYCQFDLASDLSSSQYILIKDSENNLGTFVLLPNQTKFTCDCSMTIDVTDAKFENQCEFYRLCSPNWASAFEFNLARNKGVKYFNIDCTYKPYKPYIHVNPNFGGLYGKDFDDARGLILSGEFSISVVGSEFEKYLLQNKNYQEMFNRQIESMDTQFQIERKKNILNMINTGIASGLAVGAGIASANPMAVTGGAAAAISLNTQGNNLRAAKSQYEEKRDYAIDMHNFELDNIKARPDTLTNVTAYNNNNKIFPVLEKYSCTEVEKQIFEDKIKYEGMTVNAIGKIEDYIKSDGETFIKGQILRFENLNEDNHFAQEIYNEVARGLYFERGE